jgi:hypothetical protein
VVVLNPNVLIEIGAAMALYGRRFILLVKAGTRLPSNRGLPGILVRHLEGDAGVWRVLLVVGGCIGVAFVGFRTLDVITAQLRHRGEDREDFFRAETARTTLAPQGVADDRVPDARWQRVEARCT